MSNQNFKIGDYVLRKGNLCVIEKIHYETEPPSATVKVLCNGNYVGTEFKNLSKPMVWICSHCNIDHKKMEARNCSFCQMPRTFKEQHR